MSRAIFCRALARSSSGPPLGATCSLSRLLTFFKRHSQLASQAHILTTSACCVRVTDIKCDSANALLQGPGAQQQRASSGRNLQLQQAANLFQTPLQPPPRNLGCTPPRFHRSW
jgi:hypothetical protein